MNCRNQLIAMAVKYEGNWQKIYEALEQKLFFSEEEALQITNGLKCQTLTILDKDYPTYLKMIRRPPFVLFYLGDISLLGPREKNISIIGSREPSDEGVKNTYTFVNELRKDLVVISGMAKGIDAYAHEAAIFYKRKTIAVLGSGIDICYPTDNKDLYEKLINGQLIISEYPEGTPPDPFRFPLRNRIVAGLSKCVLIIEAKRRSGTMITVMEALETNANVLCVPSSNLNDSACNLCLKDGAFLVENGDDVNKFYTF